MNNTTSCPNCGNINRPGELACSRCGLLLGPGPKTQHLDNLDLPPTLPAAPIGRTSFTSQQAITLEIGKEKLVLPTAETITLGRIVPSAIDEVPCDVDLSPFGAADKGVSRKHLLIRRRNALIYVLDLRSTNGTWLNSQQLLPNTERLLRSADKLRLGSLIMTVRF